MITTEVNALALATAANFVVGPAAADMIGKVYKLIDDAMFQGYQLGIDVGTAQAAAAVDKAFDEGWDYGEAEGKAEALAEMDAATARAGDEGYVQGVGDARARPAFADSVVQEIIGDLAQDALNAVYDEDLVQDSGDETEIFAERGYSIP
jgi:hypothetical protein